jgi:hypothetical protein
VLLLLPPSMLLLLPRIPLGCNCQSIDAREHVRLMIDVSRRLSWSLWVHGGAAVNMGNRATMSVVIWT